MLVTCEKHDKNICLADLNFSCNFFLLIAQNNRTNYKMTYSIEKFKKNAEKVH